ncbi:MAG: DUF4238 domain-containing protein [Bacteroidota bacterium]
MSGKRQHFIPQFLQEGFASLKVGDAVFTWVYRKDRPPFNTNIINVGVEGLFYTQEQDTLADDLITKAEGPLSILVEELRNSAPSGISDPRVPVLIAHLEFRTRHVRQSVMQTGSYLISRLIDFVADEDFFIHYLERKFQNDPSLLRESFAKEFREQGLPQSLFEPMTKIAMPLIPVFMAQLKPMLPVMAAQLRKGLIEKLPEAVKSGHIKALRQPDPPELKIQRYKELVYNTLPVEANSLILGDSAVLFNVEGSKPYKVLLENDDILRHVFLPLSPHTLLVGSCDGPSPSVSELRQALARCSLEYFIAHERSDENNLLREQIGEEAYPLTMEQMEEIIVEIMNG